jgi:glutamate dehydrogenase (NADP+)
MNAYIQRALEEVKQKNACESEFLQTVEEVYSSLEAVIAKHPDYEKLALLERMAEPERIISFTKRFCFSDYFGLFQGIFK